MIHIPEVSAFCPFLTCPSQAVVAASIHLQPKLDREILRETTGDCQMSFILPPLRKIIPIFSLASMMTFVLVMKRCNHQVTAINKCSDTLTLFVGKSVSLR